MPSPCPSDTDLMLFAAGDLGDAELDAVGEHLDGCARCRAALDTSPAPFASLSVAVVLDPVAAEPGLRRAVELVHLIPTPSGEEPPDDPAPLRFGRFRVVRRLGAGAMGVVYEAEDEHLGRRVAVKVLRASFAERPGARGRFVREARAAAALDHPNVVRILEVGEADAGPYLVMELLAGESVGARVRRDGALAVDEVVRVGKEVAAALAAAHAGGLIHRDVTPENIWLTADGPAKLLDFGLVRAGVGDAAVTTPGTIVGTPRFMPPEQARATAVDHRADVFGLGAVLYYAATGTFPFPGEDTLAVLSALALHTPTPADRINPAVPKRLADVLARMTAKRPADRPPTADAVVAELTAALTPRPRRWWRVAVPLVLLAAVCGWFATRPNAPPADPGTGGADVRKDDTPPPVAVSPIPDDPDRTAATWALALKGYAELDLTHDGQTSLLHTGGPAGTFTDRSAELPKGRFHLTYFGVNRNSHVSDDGLAACRGLKHLTKLQISNANLTDGGLLHFRESKKLKEVLLHNTKLTDASLSFLADFPDLRMVSVPQTRVTEAGVRKLSEALPNCTVRWNGPEFGPPFRPLK